MHLTTEGCKVDVEMDKFWALYLVYCSRQMHTLRSRARTTHQSITQCVKITASDRITYHWQQHTEVVQSSHAWLANCERSAPSRVIQSAFAAYIWFIASAMQILTLTQKVRLPTFLTVFFLIRKTIVLLSQIQNWLPSSFSATPIYQEVLKFEQFDNISW